MHSITYYLLVLTQQTTQASVMTSPPAQIAQHSFYIHKTAI